MNTTCIYGLALMAMLIFVGCGDTEPAGGDTTGGPAADSEGMHGPEYQKQMTDSNVTTGGAADAKAPEGDATAEGAENTDDKDDGNE